MPNGDDSRRLRLFERPNAAGLETGDVNEYTIANVAAGTELRVTLTWFDPPAAPGSASTLINNLDLEVVDPASTTYLGNHFTSGVSTPGGTADAKDTVEQVRFTAPAAGSYTFRVKATDVPGDGQSGSDRQGYALAVSGAFAMPDPAVYPAPTGIAVASNDSNGIALSFSGAAGAQSFQLYRAEGTCATASAGDFHMVANGAASPIVDNRTQGGFSYAYKLRGVQNDVEGDSCISSPKGFAILLISLGSVITKRRRICAGGLNSAARSFERFCTRGASTKSRRERFGSSRARTCSSRSRRWRCEMPRGWATDRACSVKASTISCTAKEI